MRFTARLADLWQRFLAWLAGLKKNGAGGDGRLSGAERDDLVSLLNNGRPAQRWLAAEALGDGEPGRGGVHALIEALGSEDPILRSEAGNALARIGGRAVRSALLAAAAANDPIAQAAAADGLGRLPADEAAAAALHAMLDSPDAVVRQSAAEALVHSGWPPPRESKESRPDPAPRLLALLADDAEPMVRRAAALALGKLGDPAAKEALMAHQEDRDEDWRVREAAALAASRLHVIEATDRPEKETEEPSPTPTVGE